MFYNKCRFVFWGIGVIARSRRLRGNLLPYRVIARALPVAILQNKTRHCERSQTLWQSVEWCLAVTRLPRHFVPRSDESGGLRSQDHHVGGMSAVGYKKRCDYSFSNARLILERSSTYRERA